MITPLDRSPQLSKRLGIDLRLKRDDLYPETGGGNKSRKMAYLVPLLRAGGYDALITTGGIQSNHARTVALAAAREGWSSHLVLHSDRESAEYARGNYLIAKMCGSCIDVVSVDEVRTRISGIEDSLLNSGRRPYVIPGGGHSVHGGAAYVDAMIEALAQFREQEWFPDYIILASGTGSTQAGLIVGAAQLGLSVQIIGISIARPAERGRLAVEEICVELERETGGSSNWAVDFRDNWTAGGYEKLDERTIRAIVFAAETEGLILDPTYTGKALAGLMGICHSGEIPPGASVLFWHTGGLPNLLSAGIALEEWLH